MAYALENSWDRADERLSSLEQCYDPATTGQLESLELRRGARCLVIGAGRGSVARWLCRRDPTASVLATDIDTRLLHRDRPPNLEVLRHDVVHDALPGDSFDLVQVRLVLMHISEREQVLARLVSVLRPGGWLLLEEHDDFPIRAVRSEHEEYERLWEAFLHTIQAAGTVTTWARKLPIMLARLGLDVVRSTAVAPYFCGGSPMARFWRLTWEQLAGGILRHGASAGDFAQVMQLLASPANVFLGPAMISATARRPESPGSP